MTASSIPKRPNRIVCAAARISSGEIVCSPRHCDRTYHQQMEHRPEEERDLWLKAEQGFIDQYGTFFNRQDALKIATAANQIIRRCGGDNIALYSENLY